MPNFELLYEFELCVSTMWLVQWLWYCALDLMIVGSILGLANYDKISVEMLLPRDVELGQLVH